MSQRINIKNEIYGILINSYNLAIMNAYNFLEWTYGIDRVNQEITRAIPSNPISEYEHAYSFLEWTYGMERVNHEITRAIPSKPISGYEHAYSFLEWAYGMDCVNREIMSTV